MSDSRGLISMKILAVVAACVAIASSAMAGEWHSDLYKQADAILVVSVKQSRGCDKYCVHVLKVEQVLRNISGKKLKSGDEIEVRSYSGTPNPPHYRFHIFVKRYPKSELWQLVQDSKSKSWDGAGMPCNEKGGKLHESCVMPDLACVTPYPDGGKACEDSSECKGGCILEVSDPSEIPGPGTKAKGICKRDDFPCGCFTTVVGGRTTQGLCSD